MGVGPGTWLAASGGIVGISWPQPTERRRLWVPTLRAGTRPDRPGHLAHGQCAAQQISGAAGTRYRTLSTEVAIASTTMPTPIPPKRRVSPTWAPGRIRRKNRSATASSTASESSPMRGRGVLEHAEELREERARRTPCVAVVAEEWTAHGVDHLAGDGEEL